MFNIINPFYGFMSKQIYKEYVGAKENEKEDYHCNSEKFTLYDHHALKTFKLTHM